MVWVRRRYDTVNLQKVEQLIGQRLKEYVVDEKMVAPVKSAEEEGKKYYDELVKLFTNEKGQFDVSRVQAMAGKSGEELKKVQS